MAESTTASYQIGQSFDVPWGETYLPGREANGAAWEIVTESLNLEVAIEWAIRTLRTVNPKPSTKGPGNVAAAYLALQLPCQTFIVDINESHVVALRVLNGLSAQVIRTPR